jgi:anthranilate/para-aminobenzoate synthase component II
LRGFSSPFDAARYHSLIVTSPLPPELIATAFTDEDEVMAQGHRSRPIMGVPFRPESILTFHKPRVMQNFLENCF